MLTAQKFVAACIRMLAFGSFLYLLLTLLLLGTVIGHLDSRAYLLFAGWGIVSVLLFVYAIPLARMIAADIDGE